MPDPHARSGRRQNAAPLGAQGRAESRRIAGRIGRAVLRRNLRWHALHQRQSGIHHPLDRLWQGLLLRPDVQRDAGRRQSRHDRVDEQLAICVQGADPSVARPDDRSAQAATETDRRRAAALPDACRCAPTIARPPLLLARRRRRRTQPGAPRERAGRQLRAPRRRRHRMEGADRQRKIHHRRLPQRRAVRGPHPLRRHRFQPRVPRPHRRPAPDRRRPPGTHDSGRSFHTWRFSHSPAAWP